MVRRSWIGITGILILAYSTPTSPHVFMLIRPGVVATMSAIVMFVHFLGSLKGHLLGERPCVDVKGILLRETVPKIR